MCMKTTIQISDRTHRTLKLLKEQDGRSYDAILQDVDNGPESLTVPANAWLYSDAGLKAAAEALRPKGVLALWSAKSDRKFVKRLRKAGFDVNEIPVRSRDRHRGSHYVIWTAALR